MQRWLLGRRDSIADIHGKEFGFLLLLLVLSHPLTLPVSKPRRRLDTARGKHPKARREVLCEPHQKTDTDQSCCGVSLTFLPQLCHLITNSSPSLYTCRHTAASITTADSSSFRPPLRDVFNGATNARVTLAKLVFHAVLLQDILRPCR